MSNAGCFPSAARLSCAYPSRDDLTCVSGPLASVVDDHAQQRSNPMKGQRLSDVPLIYIAHHEPSPSLKQMSITCQYTTWTTSFKPGQPETGALRTCRNGPHRLVEHVFTVHRVLIPFMLCPCELAAFWCFGPVNTFRRPNC